MKSRRIDIDEVADTLADLATRVLRDHRFAGAEGLAIVGRLDAVRKDITAVVMPTARRPVAPLIRRDTEQWV